jgi:hypothetical protein
MKLINSFLNNFEFFLKRLLFALGITLIFPFILMGYILGLFNFNIEKKYDDYKE